MNDITGKETSFNGDIAILMLLCIPSDTWLHIQSTRIAELQWTPWRGKNTLFLYSKLNICTKFLPSTVILLTSGDLLLTYSTKWEMRVRLLISDNFFLNSSWKRIVPVGDSKINKPWCVHVEQIPCVSLESSLYRFSVECFLLIFLQSNELHILYPVLRHKSLCWMGKLQQFAGGGEVVFWLFCVCVIFSPSTEGFVTYVGNMKFRLRIQTEKDQNSVILFQVIICIPE